MVKVVILLGLVLFSEIHGIPTIGPIPDDSSATERSRVGGWITLPPSWPFSSIPSMSGLFRNAEPIENAMKLLKKRIENLEKSQKSVVELLKRINLGEVNSPCNTNKSSQSEEPIPSLRTEKINKKKSPVKPTSPLTPSVSTAIDRMPEEVDSTISSKDSQAEMTILVASEKPITSITLEPVKYEQSTTPSGNEDNREIAEVSDIEIPHNNTTSVSNTEKIKIEDDKNLTEIPDSLGLIMGLVSPGVTRANTKFIWDPQIQREKL